MPAQKLTRLPCVNHQDSKKRIFWNLNIAPRYSYRLYSVPIGPQWLDYLEFQIKFAKKLSPDVRKRIVCKLYPIDYGWNVAFRVKDELVDVELDATGKPWHKLIKNASLVIETTNLTTLLESKAADIPTVLVLEPKLWEIRATIASHFDELKKVGIYHTQGGEAADFINEVSVDPLSSWKRSEVQNTRRRFCQAFANTSKAWLKEWKKELLSVMQ